MAGEVECINHANAFTVDLAVFFIFVGMVIGFAGGATYSIRQYLRDRKKRSPAVNTDRGPENRVTAVTKKPSTWCGIKNRVRSRTEKTEHRPSL